MHEKNKEAFIGILLSDEYFKREIEQRVDEKVYHNHPFVTRNRCPYHIFTEELLRQKKSEKSQ